MCRGSSSSLSDLVEVFVLESLHKMRNGSIAMIA